MNEEKTVMTKEELTKNQFVKLLRIGHVYFKYTKKDGTVREAKGTLLFESIPFDKHPKGTQTYETPDNIVKYYDLDKESWRSFDWNNFIECW